jgi:hypothetical protein
VYYIVIYIFADEVVAKDVEGGWNESVIGMSPGILATSVGRYFYCF